MLATGGRGSRCELAALLQSGSLALDRLWLVLAIRLFVGLGALPLWPVVSQPASRLGLGSRHNLGTGLGDLALFRYVLRLGAIAARSVFRCWNRFQIWPREGRCRL